MPDEIDAPFQAPADRPSPNGLFDDHKYLEIAAAEVGTSPRRRLPVHGIHSVERRALPLFVHGRCLDHAVGDASVRAD
jgi:hypothetical protein